MRDPHATRFIVIPFRKGSGGDLLPVEVRSASTSVGAVRVAHSMREPRPAHQRVRTRTWPPCRRSAITQFGGA